MNKLIVPPSPNWYESGIFACAVDNTIVYGSRSDIVIIFPTTQNESADIKIISKAHNARISSVSVNVAWNDNDKLIASAGDDNLVCLWDANSCTKKSSNKYHTTRQDKITGVTFAGNDRVVSISEEGALTIWRLSNNDITSFNVNIGKDKVSCLSMCPHVAWLAACGTKKGLIYIIDLRKTGTLMKKLRGYDSSSICSLSWCPTPYNIFPAKNKPEERNKDHHENVKLHNSDTNEDSAEVPTEEQAGKATQTTTEANTKEYSSEHAQNILEPDEIQIENMCNAEDLTLQSNSDESENKKQDSEQPDDLITNDKCEADEVKSEDEKLPDMIDKSNNEECNAMNLLETNNDITSPENNSNNLASSNEIICENGKISDQIVKEYLLASVSRSGRVVLIWNVNKGRKQTELHLPNKKNVNFSQFWTALCWYKPKSLLASSFKGDLLQMNLSSFSNKPKWSIVHTDHNGLIFIIASPIRRYDSPEDEDWRDKNLLNAWTVGKDRCIFNTSLSSDRKILNLYVTFSSSINCFAASLLDPTRIAIGTGGGVCRLWDLSRPHSQIVNMSLAWEKMYARITSLAWHPIKETILAFGTDEGKVGLIDAGNPNKPPMLLIQDSNYPVYNLQWAPLQNDSDDFRLYCVVDGSVIVYNTNKQSAPTVINLPTEERVTQISWKPDYTVCAVGTKQSAIIFSPCWESLGNLLLQQKEIKCYAWHPQATAENDSVSSCANWLAVGAEKVVVYDCTLLKGHENEKYSKGIVAEFSDHVSNVYCLAWSPHVEGKLASASCDGSALVWDVKSKTLLHCCRPNYFTQLLSVLWSPLNDDYIITGSKDSIIQIWKLSENSPQEKIKMKDLRKQLGPQNSMKITMENNEDGESKNKRKRKYVLSTVPYFQNLTGPEAVEVCKQLFKAINGDVAEEDKNPLMQLFGNKKDVDKLLELEKNTNSKHQYADSNTYISLWQGDAEKVVRDAIASKTVTSVILGLAPMVSHSLWQEACCVYAEQLSENPRHSPLEISSYYLACHKIEEAIDTLCNGLMFREALALAKSRLLPDDPIITKVLECWAEKSVSSGNLETAVHCHLALGEINDAARILSRRLNKDALEFCAELAKECNDDDLLNVTLYRLNNLATDNKSDDNLVPLLSRTELELKVQESGINNED